MDTPELFNRLAKILFPTSGIRFIILLWGDKSILDSKMLSKIPIFTYEEIEDLGEKSRDSLMNSMERGKFMCNILNMIYKLGNHLTRNP